MSANFSKRVAILESQKPRPEQVSPEFEAAAQQVVEWWNRAKPDNIQNPIPPQEPPIHFNAVQRKAYAALISGLIKFYKFTG